MLTTVAAGRVFDFSHVVGRGALSGEGFRMAVSLALGESDTLYAVNRGWEQVQNVPATRTQLGTRIGKFTIGPVPGDEEFVVDFSKPGANPGELYVACLHCAGSAGKRLRHRRVAESYFDF